jgi:hypothetical protein
MRKLTTSRGGGAMERIKNFISVSEGFQKSINIEYDITNEDKIKGFILTSASLELILIQLKEREYLLVHTVRVSHISS